MNITTLRCKTCGTERYLSVSPVSEGEWLYCPTCKTKKEFALLSKTELLTDTKTTKENK